jgi:hypothetical protein
MVTTRTERIATTRKSLDTLFLIKTKGQTIMTLGILCL